MTIQDTPCEFDSKCDAPVELYSKELDIHTQKWIGIFVCLNKHNYKKPIDITLDGDTELWNVEPDSDLWEGGIQEELPFSEGMED